MGGAGCTSSATRELPMSTESITTIAGPAGVGALCFLGIFLFLDGRAPTLFPTVEVYAKTATWGIVVAIPVLVMAYVIGALVSACGVLAIQSFAGPTFAQEVTELSQLAALAGEKSVAVDAYTMLIRDRSVFVGCAGACMILCAGALSEIRNLPHLRPSIITMAIAVLVFGCLLFWLAIRKGAEAHILATQIILSRGS